MMVAANAAAAAEKATSSEKPPSPKSQIRGENGKHRPQKLVNPQQAGVLLQRPTNLDLLHTHTPCSEVVRLSSCSPDPDDREDPNGNIEEDELVGVVNVDRATAAPAAPHATSSGQDSVGSAGGLGAHSGDEGISSEASNSPQPPPTTQNGDISSSNNNNNNNNLNEVENNNCDSTVTTSFFHRSEVVVGSVGVEGSCAPSTCTPAKQKLSMKSPLNDKSPVSPLMSSPCDDRVPSRIPLSVSGKGKN